MLLKFALNLISVLHLPQAKLFARLKDGVDHQSQHTRKGDDEEGAQTPKDDGNALQMGIQGRLIGSCCDANGGEARRPLDSPFL